MTSFPEPVSPWRGWIRKARTLGTVANRLVRKPRPDQYDSEVRVLCEQSARARSLAAGIWKLWRIESLTLAVADSGATRFSLAERSLPLEAGPPAHCGLSMAAVLADGFDAEALTRRLEERSEPRFIDFAFESLGLMQAAYERDTFGRITGALGKVGLLRRYQVEFHDPATFLSELPERWRGYAAHGYGRMLYFKSHRLNSAISAISRRTYLPFAPAVKGAVAACMLVNGRDAGRLLDLADAKLEGPTKEAVRGGLENVCTLLEWSLPGCLSKAAPDGPAGREVLELAHKQAKARLDKNLGPGLVA